MALGVVAKLFQLTESGPARWLVAAMAVVFVANLFYLGAKPFAVGLIPSPWDKLAHLASFGLLAGLLWLGGLRKQSAWVVVVVTLIGAADELHQHFLPGREGDPFDVLADVLAALWAVAILNGIDRMLARRRERG